MPAARECELAHAGFRTHVVEDPLGSEQCEKLPRHNATDGFMTGRGRRLFLMAAVAAGVLALAAGAYSASQRVVTKELYYQQLRIVLYDTREALQFSIREAIGAENSEFDSAGAAMSKLPARVRGITPPRRLRGAHERLEQAARIASEELTNAPPTRQGRISGAVLAERRISELIMLTETLASRESG